MDISIVLAKQNTNFKLIKKFIYASTSSVYGMSDSPRVDEEHELVPLTDYNKYKALCERILKKYLTDNNLFFYHGNKNNKNINNFFLKIEKLKDKNKFQKETKDVLNIFKHQWPSWMIWMTTPRF